MSPSLIIAYFKSQGLPVPKLEHQHIPGRKFRLDFAWPDEKIGIEVQGGIFTRGAHGAIQGILRDMEKRNLQLLNGWRVIEVTPDNLCRLNTVKMVKQLFDNPPDLTHVTQFLDTHATKSLRKL